MIKKTTIAICDFCGATAPAKLVDVCRNEELYGIPDGWLKGKTDAVCFCPTCARKLNSQSGAMRDAPQHGKNLL